MVITHAAGSFTVAENDRPNSPMEKRRVNSTAATRVNTGGLYDPVAYSFYERSFVFENVRLACVNNFKTMFGTASEFTLTDDLMGTLTLVKVPGSFRVEYSTWNVASCFFTAQDTTAVDSEALA